MDTFDAIYQRRAIKSFDPDYRLTKEEETRLLSAAIQGPTSFNIQHWVFVIARDPALMVNSFDRSRVGRLREKERPWQI